MSLKLDLRKQTFTLDDEKRSLWKSDPSRFVPRKLPLFCATFGMTTGPVAQPSVWMA